MSATWENWHLRAKAAKSSAPEKRPDVEIAESVSSLLEAAGRTPVKRAVVNHWFNGKRQPSLAEFFALCAVIDADPKVMLFGEPDRRTLATVTDLITKDERLLLDGFRLADASTKRHLLRMAEDSLADFGKRTGENNH